MTYTRADLTEEEHKLLQMTYAEFKERFGGMSNSLTHELCLHLHCNETALERMPILDLTTLNEPWGADAWAERWACRWIIGSREMNQPDPGGRSCS